MSSPPVAPPRACADGVGRVRSVRARKLPAGFLALAASFFLLSPGRSHAQFPIRQIPPRLNVFPAAQPPPLASPTNSLPPQALPAAPQPSQAPHPAVARIIVPEKGAVSYGSGSLVDVRGQFGLVVTNWHVVRDAAGQISVEFPGGFKSPAQVVKTDHDWDLAALSVYRPPVTPIAITSAAPQLGESLTIAGYGDGKYRAASGSLGNYVSPSPDLPQEMLDIARVEARQGDSGGPIFNQRGELCGVLFGAGHGYTNGSYGGRVLQFLTTVVPGGTPGGDALAQLALAPPPAEGTPPQATALHQPQPPIGLPLGPPLSKDGWAVRGGAPADAAGSSSPAPMPLDVPLLTPPPPRDEPASRVALAPAALREADAVAAAIHSSLPPRITTGVPASAGVDVNQAPPAALAAAIWRQVGGTTAVDQGKTILAIVGVLSLLVFGWRISRPREPEHDED